MPADPLVKRGTASNPTDVDSDGWLRRRVLAVSGTGLALVLAAFFSAWPHLPEPMARHYAVNGTPDAASPRLWVVLFLSAAMSVLPAALLWPRKRGTHLVPNSLAFAVCVWGAGMVVTVTVSTLASNWNAPSWQHAAPVKFTSMAWVLGVPAMLAIATARLARRPDVNESGRSRRSLFHRH
jgi:Protein of unknown function (DUF1648)